MKVEGINTEEILSRVKEELAKEPNISPALKSSIEMILIVFVLLLNRLGLNSKNSSKPPSSDPNREKKKLSSKKKAGGQPGHKGVTLKKFDTPDVIKTISVNRDSFTDGDYSVIGFEARQVVDLDISRLVTEYRAEILQDRNGKKLVAPFPDHVTKAVQYGNQVKAHAIYLSQYQLLPYERIKEYFSDQLGIPISPGSLFNFNQSAFEKLELFEEILKTKLGKSPFLHADETGINIQGKRNWLHCLSSDKLTLLYPHQKRGNEAMDEMGVLSKFNGTLCHDHWKPYYRYTCEHALCNAHHLRELERAMEQDDQQWAERMQELLLEINKAVKESGGFLVEARAKAFRVQYRKILEEGQKECPPPVRPPGKKKRGRIPKSKSRNLLERLRAFENDTLRFMDDPIVTFTNNQGENDLRMTKVQQKISGCFRSHEGAKIFCRVRSYLSTCRKNGVTASKAMELLLDGKLPKFLMAEIKHHFLHAE